MWTSGTERLGNQYQRRGDLGPLLTCGCNLSNFRSLRTEQIHASHFTSYKISFFSSTNNYINFYYTSIQSIDDIIARQHFQRQGVVSEFLDHEEDMINGEIRAIRRKIRLRAKK
jgi:hypothetical protein